MDFSSLNIRTEREANNALIVKLYKEQTSLEASFQKGCLQLLKETQTAIEKLPNALKVSFEISKNNQTLFIKKGYAGVEINLYDNGTFSTVACQARNEGKGKRKEKTFYLVHDSVDGAPAHGTYAPAEEIGKCLPNVLNFIRTFWQKPVAEEKIRTTEDSSVMF